jgi:hypothetical protein
VGKASYSKTVDDGNMEYACAFVSAKRGNGLNACSEGGFVGVNGKRRLSLLGCPAVCF